MDLMEYVNDAARWVRSNAHGICLAWAASVLVIYGTELARCAKSIAKEWHFVFRLLFFVIVCAFGYGWLSLFLAAKLSGQVKQLSNIWILVAVSLMFIIIGLIADKKQQM